MAIDYNKLCKELATWLDQWEFTAFVTLTNECTVRASNDIPASYESKVSRYLASVEKEMAVPVSAIGINTLSYGGYLHSHLVLLKKGGLEFSSNELRIFERKWYRQADAQEVTKQSSLLEYIASEKHIRKCRNFDCLVFGDGFC
jgi:hypothetical protein